jgi:hypothetical protein
LALAGVARLAEIAADIGTALAPWPAPKSTATRPTPVFQQSLKNCTDATGSLRSAIMIELEVYAQGLRDLNKILELDLQLEPVAGLHYKIDTNHDLVYFEFDRPTLSMREIRAIFLKLGLEPLFVGAIPPELRPRTKTEPLTA